MEGLCCGRFEFSLDRPLVMGILNVTPDSFSDGGKFVSKAAAFARAEQLLEEGADILDIGGESTRPNAPFVSEQEEMDRVLPVLEALQTLNCPISLDTRRTKVMREALKIGVDLINDVSALEDEGALELLKNQDVAICLMHKQGNPDTMQIAPNYAHVVEEVLAYLRGRVEVCLAAGVDARRLLIDPGFGFGKTLQNNLDLLLNLPRFSDELGIPLLVGMSRKSMLGEMTGEREPTLRLGASIAVALFAAEVGAKVVRVHDVRETRQAFLVQASLNEARRRLQKEER